MFAPDLSTECQVARGPEVRAIGWLEHGHPFPTAPPDAALVAALRRHVDDPGRWCAVYALGGHACDLDGCGQAVGMQHVVIPARTCVYVAPELIVHYVELHRYAPPAAFVAAVLACPEQSSSAYTVMLAPFASAFGIDAAGVRRIAARAPDLRRAHAEAEAQRAASRGNFRW